MNGWMDGTGLSQLPLLRHRLERFVDGLTEWEEHLATVKIISIFASNPDDEEDDDDPDGDQRDTATATATATTTVHGWDVPG